MRILHGKHLLAGGRTATEGSPFQAMDPKSGKALQSVFYDATPEEIDFACRAAEGTCQRLYNAEPARIAELLEAVADEILEIGDDLIERAGLETALPEGRLKGERGRTVGQARMFAKLIRDGDWAQARIDTAISSREPVPKPDVRQMLRPIGPVVVFGASNFPLAFSVAGGDTVSALAAGCPVVVKANRAHPGTSELVGEALVAALRRTGMPDGMFSLIHGHNHAIGQGLVTHPSIRAVGFTGSFVGGKALFDAANQRPDPIQVYAEMGSINPVFVLPGVLARRAKALASAYIQSVTLGVGQFCTNPGLVFGVAGPEMDRFMDAVAREAEVWAPETMLHAGICTAFGEGIEVLDSMPGVLRIGASTTEADGSSSQAPCVIYATESDTFEKSSTLSNEVFGPSSLIVVCKNQAEMIRMAEGLEGHLTASIHATDEEMNGIGDLLQVLERKVGRLIRNGFPTGVEVCSSMHHGGPYPATTDVHFTSVGTAAILRWVRPVCYQNFTQQMLPAALRNDNPLGILRLVNGSYTRDSC